MRRTGKWVAAMGAVALICLASVPGAVAGTTSSADAIAARLAAGATTRGVRLLAIDPLRRFYQERGLRPAWLAAGRLSPQIDQLLAALRAADHEGLRPADYRLEAIDLELERLRENPPGMAFPFPEVAADLDLLLTDAFLLYAAHLTGGRVSPEAVEPEWNISGRGRDLVFLLSAALENGHLATTLADLPPARQDYRRLRDALPGLRAVAAAGGWPIVPWGKPLREGDRGPRVAALRRRLAATGELPAAAGGGGAGAADVEERDATGDLFDARLAAALGRFQARHGIEVDGIAGKRTLSELNTPAGLRAAQIVANLERLRWLPRELPPRHLLVNVADYRLELTEGGRAIDAMKVIAGRQARRTPFFTGEITSIRLNPTWTVPEKIAVEDKLPAILEDPDFLAEQGFRVFARAGAGWKEVDPSAIDWSRLSENNFPYRLRQDPGPRNALGRIKFQVPNRHDIYLHDTPSRGLFARAERGFSSGCIRVERPLDLAVRLLGADPEWPRARIVETIASLETVDIELPEPMPVYILFWTAWVDDAGLLQFREDLYGRDTAILEALAKPLAAP